MKKIITLTDNNINKEKGFRPTYIEVAKSTMKIPIYIYCRERKPDETTIALWKIWYK